MCMDRAVIEDPLNFIVKWMSIIVENSSNLKRWSENRIILTSG